MDTTHAEIAYVTKQIKAVEMVIKKLELELKTAEESSATGDQYPRFWNDTVST